MASPGDGGARRCHPDLDVVHPDVHLLLAAAPGSQADDPPAAGDGVEGEVPVIVGAHLTDEVAARVPELDEGTSALVDDPGQPRHASRPYPSSTGAPTSDPYSVHDPS